MCIRDRVNVEKLSQYTKEVGAKLVIDVTQAAGAVPISINDWAVDILVCSGYKWLGSHGGIAFGWFSDEILALDPPAIGWFGNENPLTWKQPS